MAKKVNPEQVDMWASADVLDPYVRMTMEEIRVVPWNGLMCVGSFSGCGGSSLGLRMAGWKVPYAIEFIPAAADTYEANSPSTFVDRRDIREVKAQEILDTLGLKAGELDLFEGSPPCASFSAAGMGESGWGTVKKYCLSPETRILRSDLTWVDAGSLVLGDELVGFDEEPVSGLSRKFRDTRVLTASTLRRPGVRVTMDDGAVLTCSQEHRWLIGSGRNRRWKQAISLRAGDELLTVGRWLTDPSRDAGWLAGFADGEGCIAQSGLVSITQRHGPALDYARAALRKRGYAFTENPWSDGTGVTLNVSGGLPERMRFLGEIRPARLLAKAGQVYKSRNTGAAKRASVVRVEEIGDIDVVAIGTDTKTLIADGFLSHNSDSEQRTDDLFEEWVRLLGDLQPRAFVAENVPGMLTGKALEEYAHVTTRALGAKGYRVAAKVLNSSNYGVPQDRRRLIFLGYREDLEVHPEFPRRTTPDAHTTRQALESVLSGDSDHAEWLEESSMEGKAVGRTWEWKVKGRDKNVCARCERPLAEHVNAVKTVGSVKKKKGQVGALREKPIRVCADGQEATEIKDYFLLTVPGLDRACPTLTATGSQVGAASVVHPTECRKFTPAEAKALCGFPADFILTGTREQRYERMGRAVTPPLYQAMGRGIADALGWACAGCGTREEERRYDDGSACETCVTASFAEHG